MQVSPLKGGAWVEIASVGLDSVHELSGREFVYNEMCHA